MMCSTFINFNTKLREGASFGQPITEYDPGSMGFRDFVRLSRELISNGGPEMVPTTLLRQADDLAQRAEKLLATSKPLFDKNGAAQFERKPATPEQVQEKIDAIYGVRTCDEGVLFVADAPGANSVHLAGDFNNWSADATPMVSSNKDAGFRALLPLAPGCYSYRYVIDGHWQADPHNDRSETNPFGELNSIVEVS